MKNGWKLVISLAVPLLVGAVAGFFTRPEIDGWYRGLQKPSWQPPNGVFAPVWTTLYILMGIAFFLVWKSDAPAGRKQPAMNLWIVQLVLNFFWSFIFFNLHKVALAMGEIALLWVALLLTIFAFARVSKAAAWLLVPYISWVSFASLLNFAILRLNG